MFLQILFLLMNLLSLESSTVFETLCPDNNVDDKKFACGLYNSDKNLGALTKEIEDRYLQYFMTSINSNQIESVSESYHKKDIHGFLTKLIDKLSLTSLKLIVPTIKGKMHTIG